MGTRRERDVVGEGERFERAYDLLGQRQPGSYAAVDRPSGHVLPAEHDKPGLGAQDTGDDAHQGGLACAVGTDETEQLPLAHLERDVFDGNHPAESHGDLFDAEQRHRPAPARSLRATCATPPGAKRMVAKTSTP